MFLPITQAGIVRLHALFRLIQYVVPLFFLGILPACLNKHDERHLIVGMLSADAPFMSINSNGICEGFDVDVAKYIADRLHKTLLIKDMGVPELFTALQYESIDMMMCGLSITKQRQERFIMIHYQGNPTGTFPLVFWQQVPPNITNLEDFRGTNATIAVLPGTIQEQLLATHPYITPKVIGSYADIIMNLQFGKITAALFDEAIASYAQQFPDLKVIQVPIGDFRTYGNGIALNKNNDILGKQVAAIIQEMKDNGIMEQLEIQWMHRHGGNVS